MSTEVIVALIGGGALILTALIAALVPLIQGRKTRNEISSNNETVLSHLLNLTSKVDGIETKLDRHLTDKYRHLY